MMVNPASAAGQVQKGIERILALSDLEMDMPVDALKIPDDYKQVDCQDTE